MIDEVGAANRVAWEHLEQYGSEQNYRRRALIYTPGQAAETLYLLKAGQVSLQFISASGRALTLQVVEAGQFFGHSVLAGSLTYDTFAEAIKPAQVLAISREQIFQIAATIPQVGTMLLETLGRYRMMISHRLDEVAFKSVPARLASLLLEMAEAAAAAADGRPEFVLPRRTHQQLADMINAYRETVTKVISQFRDAQLLDIDRTGITLLNPTRLRELAQD